jgi:hypothetical protein
MDGIVTSPPNPLSQKERGEEVPMGGFASEMWVKSAGKVNIFDNNV